MAHQVPWTKVLVDNFVELAMLSEDQELKCVQRKVLELKAIDYDLSIIVPMQDEIHDKYKEKLDNMKYNF